ncbi:uncharacterized protein LOC116267895 isoform X2 [Nymphaea colorata]|uniref:uncharacterized protein LOC116267895 isoform X2 n=1 Tax=Nymphaea colorata TaxID=210225 RepID=UPI00129DB5DF|nr:uncharacterized protein LOC116267895 isoform X2 [Nymphaea colorata]XP_031505681.1 uncharacterized protein LOC116267895 isoform X2 [Nymphaea colorata]
MGRAEKARERRESRLREVAHQRSIPYTEEEKWWSPKTVAVVTGSNRGIGFAIARQLGRHGLHVIITSRHSDEGQAAMLLLQKEGLNVNHHPLDVLDSTSVKLFAEWILENYEGLDILVNNAGVNFNTGSDNSVEFAERVIETNYFGTKRVIESMVPLMRSAFNARIVNTSSRLGRLNGRRNRLGDVNQRKQLSDDSQLCEELIDVTVGKFLEEVKNGCWESGGWPQIYTDYSVSKLAVNAYTRLIAKKLSIEHERKICVNCYCPGWVKTAMTGWAGNMTTEEGADTAVWLALFPGEPPTGKFFAERREISF